MEAVRTSETSVDNYFTRQYIPEDNSEHNTCRRENLKSHKTNLITSLIKLTVFCFIDSVHTRSIISFIMQKCLFTPHHTKSYHTTSHHAILHCLPDTNQVNCRKSSSYRTQNINAEVYYIPLHTSFPSRFHVKSNFTRVFLSLSIFEKILFNSKIF
jgi:hypothetical protein